MNLLEQQNDQFELDPGKNYLEELVGEGKKFKDQEALAKGKAVSDHYIGTLERSLDELRNDYRKLSDEYNAGQSARELLDQLNNREQTPPSRDNTLNSNEDNKAQFNLKEVESLVSNQIKLHEQTRKEAENFSSVQNKAKELFGNSYQTVLKQKAEELNLSDDELNKLARSNPTLFYKTFDMNAQAKGSFQAPARSDVRSDSFTPRSSDKRTLSYYQKMRVQNPLLYHDPKIILQMEKDSQALGAEFFDN